MAKLDPEVVAHLEWLGFVRPIGLVVSAPALVRAGAILDRRDIAGQRLLQSCVQQRTFSGEREAAPWLSDFRSFAESVLGWSFSPRAYAGVDGTPVPSELEATIPGYELLLRPTFAISELDPANGASPWQLLIDVLEPNELFDAAKDKGDLSPNSRIERLLRKTGVPAGLLFNGRAMRLISAPYGESSGWIDFRVADMVQTAGRPICTAMRLLLGEERLLSLPRHQRLTALLQDSRKFQNEVSEKLAEQVLHALYELLRGFQSANDLSKGELLRRPLEEHPDDVYRALLTVILRLVFLLYAEERDMLPEEDEAFLNHYSLTGLYERLREDGALYPDTMDQRFGAWAQLLALFRMIYDGAQLGAVRLPTRHGVLFDPDRYPFLEGRPKVGARQKHERIEAPRVPDGTLYRALDKLLVLDGERISYRALDVEEIGSVYETMMGFRLETATGPSVAIKSQKRAGAPATLNIETLLAQPGGQRTKWLQDHADRKLTERVKAGVAAAKTVNDLHAALQPVIDSAATPDLVPNGSMVLQPSEERRRSGSHYTPRTLTEPIVERTLEPILRRLRGDANQTPTAEQILELKVCDPAMGSGAFLVESCRQLADELVDAWKTHGDMPKIPHDEDDVVFARRLVAQRCLYGVDRNPVAVDLSKVSLWLATLAREHSFTFVDHALRQGDSLVGLSRAQIEAFHWDASKAPVLHGLGLRDALDKATELRRRIRRADDEIPEPVLRDLLDQAETELAKVRLVGDLVILAFFTGANATEREQKRSEFARQVMRGAADQHRDLTEERRHADQPLVSFHWDVEFPEVFDRENGGFDAIVGNPPFAGHVTVVSANPLGYTEWLRELHVEASGKCDLVAHFFRRAFNALRKQGTLGLIATNTIGQGDTRSSGLRWICNHGGEIYAARKRVKWPGLAAVVVSVVHVHKGAYAGVRRLDDRDVQRITAFLFHRGSNDDPAQLRGNSGGSFQGSIVLGMGFTFDDTDKKGVATPLSEMRRLITKNSQNGEVIFPYVGGEEVNTSPTHVHHRYVINFGERSEAECRRRWPELLAIIEQKVKPERLKIARTSRSSHGRRAAVWWQHYHQAKDLYSAIAALDRVLAISRVGQQASIAFLPSRTVFSDSLIVFPFDTYAAFSALQSRPHEIWVRFFGSSMKDDLRYTPSDGFETFPFPPNWEADSQLEAAGKAYYEFRAAILITNGEGLTTTYNRFHDELEHDPQIVQLRNLHGAMDRAVLDAYGWNDIPTECDFLLEYEIDEEEWGDKKKPYRYRWPNEVRDEVLARLLELNAQRAREESRSGASDSRNAASKGKKGKAPKPQTEDMFS